MVEWQRAQVRGLLSEQQMVAARNGIDCGHFAPSDPQYRAHYRAIWEIPEDVFCIGVVGVIQERKQTKHLLDVLAAMRAEGHNAWGVIAGEVFDPEYAEYIRNSIRDLGPEPHVRMVGHVDNIAIAYSAFDLTASFSKIETFGLSVAESIACGIPVIYYQIDVLDEVTGPGGVPVPMADVKKFAEECGRLAENPQRLSEMGTAGMKHVQANFSADASVSRLAEVFDEVLNAEKVEKHRLHSSIDRVL